MHIAKRRVWWRRECAGTPNDPELVDSSGAPWPREYQRYGPPQREDALPWDYDPALAMMYASGQPAPKLRLLVREQSFEEYVRGEEAVKRITKADVLNRVTTRDVPLYLVRVFHALRYHKPSPLLQSPGQVTAHVAHVGVHRMLKWSEIQALEAARLKVADEWALHFTMRFPYQFGVAASAVTVRRDTNLFQRTMPGLETLAEMCGLPRSQVTMMALLVGAATSAEWVPACSPTYARFIEEEAKSVQSHFAKVGLVAFEQATMRLERYKDSASPSL